MEVAHPTSKKKLRLTWLCSPKTVFSLNSAVAYVKPEPKIIKRFLRLIKKIPKHIQYIALLKSH